MKKVIAILAVAGAAAAVQAQDRIDSMRSDITGSYVNIAGSAGATRLTSSTSSQDDCSFSFAGGVTNAALPGSVYRVCINGFLQVSGSTFTGGTGYSNSSIAASGNVLGTVATFMPWWDDFITNIAASGGLWVRTADATTGFGGISVGGVPVVGNVTIVQWQNMDLFGLANTQNVSFQMQIFANPVDDPTTGNRVYAQALYQQTSFGTGPGSLNNNGASATIGWQRGNAPAGANFQWGFGNTTFPSGGTNSVITPYSGISPITDGLVLSFVPTPGAASLLGIGFLAVGRRRR